MADGIRLSAAGGSIAAVAAGALVATGMFLSLGLRGDLSFALTLRATQLAALVTVGVAIAVSTVVFQTVTANRILTPSLVGLDALYILVQTAFVFVLGGVGTAALPPLAKFAFEAGALSALVLALFLPLMRARSDLTLLLLAGVVLGILFRSLSDLLSRLIDPNSFAIVQALRVADFNTIETSLLWPCAALTAAAAAILWRQRHVLDVMALGPDIAVSLGVDWRRSAALMLALVGLLTAAATALVGPVVFLGLVATALAGRLAADERHGVKLPLAGATGVLLLVSGQTLVARLFGLALPLGVIIELVGGVVFILLVARYRR